MNEPPCDQPHEDWAEDGDEWVAEEEPALAVLADWSEHEHGRDVEEEPPLDVNEGYHDSDDGSADEGPVHNGEPVFEGPPSGFPVWKPAARTSCGHAACDEEKAGLRSEALISARAAMDAVAATDRATDRAVQAERRLQEAKQELRRFHASINDMARTLHRGRKDLATVSLPLDALVEPPVGTSSTDQGTLLLLVGAGRG